MSSDIDLMDPIRTQIIVPCYNEARRLPSSEFDTYLATHAGVGFIFVNDGSTDNTLEILQSLQRRWGEHIQVIDQQPEDRGKAEAVRVGVLHAGVDVRYVGYFDADLATPLDAIAEFVEILNRDPAVDLVIGARVALLGRKIRRRPLRHYCGRMVATVASLVLGIPVYATQCGAKVFRRAPLVHGCSSRYIRVPLDLPERRDDRPLYDPRGRRGEHLRGATAPMVGGQESQASRRAISCERYRDGQHLSAISTAAELGLVALASERALSCSMP